MLLKSISSVVRWRFVRGVLIDPYCRNEVLSYKYCSLCCFAASFNRSGKGCGEYSLYWCSRLFASSVFSIIYSMALQARPEKANQISGLMITAVAGGEW